jgi:hypothetical protein
MGAITECLERVACALPAIGIEADAVGVIVPAHGHADALDLESVQLPSVSIRLLDLADDA